MKVFSIVGIRASGKTTTVTCLTQELGRRGLKVGTVKSIFCPTFTMDEAGSNTHRHRQAGAKIICARAKGETALIFPHPMDNERLLSYYQDMDCVILEGDYLAAVPRLVAAHREEDAAPRINGLTIALVGKIAGSRREALGLPAFNPLTDIQALADLIIQRVPEISPKTIAPNLPGDPAVTGDAFCQCGCEKHVKKAAKAGVTAQVGGKELKLTKEQEAYLMSLAADHS